MTHKSFIRYYITEMPHSLARVLQVLTLQLHELNGWQWIPINEFDYENSYGHLPGTNDPEIGCIIRKCTGVVEHRNPEAVVGTSLVWKTSPPAAATSIDDILTLCSIAKSQHVYARAQEGLSPEGKSYISQGATTQSSDLKEIVPQKSLPSFVTDSLATLGRKGWKDLVGFTPAVWWYAQAQRSFRAGMFNLEVALYWIVLEILGLAHAQNKGLTPNQLKRTTKSDLVKEFIESKGFTGADWSFLEEATSDWYQIRCHAFHEGTLPNWPTQQHEQRWRQLAEFTSFVLADLMQSQSQTHKKQIGVRLSGY